MKSFWGKLKTEWLEGRYFTTQEAAKTAIFEYIEVYYNRQRPHEANEMLTPEAYCRQTLLNSAA